MKASWVIVNRDSGSHDPAACKAIARGLERCGREVRFISIPEDSMPGAAQATRSGVDLIVIFAGDGTVSAAVRALEGWQGDMLVLPGGTMNLLSRKLHGERPPLDILEDSLSPGAARLTLPVAEGHGLRSLVGIIAGPTAAWGGVREDMRRIDLAGLIQSVPQALQETLQGEPVRVDGVEGEFQAVFIDPREDGLNAKGILAGTAAELLQHGWAWMMGDFRDGPSKPLVRASSITLRRDGDFALLVDGEQADAGSPCRFVLARCRVRFIATRAG